MNLVVVGNGAAGTTAALEARKRDQEANIILISKSKDLQYSPCALPFVIEGDIKSFDDLVIHTQDFYKKLKIELKLETEVTKILPKENKIETSSGEIPYDKLIIATGGHPKIPPIPGTDLENVFTLATLEDGRSLNSAAATAKKAVIIGAGMVGLETAAALKKRGLDVTVVEMLPQVLPQVLDQEVAKEVQEHLSLMGIKFLLDTQVSELKGIGKVEAVIAGKTLPADLVLIAAGVRKNTKLAEGAGIKIGVTEGIKVDSSLRTGIPNIYAAGDCVEATDLITGKPASSMLGTAAVRQGKIAGSNVAGGELEFWPVLNSTITRIGKLEVGTVGLTEAAAKKHGLEISKATFTGSSRPEYFPGGKPITVKLVSDASGKIIGAQLVGGERIFGRLLALSYAIQKGITAKELAFAETPYCPPVSPTIDPITIAAELLLRRLKK